MGVLGKHGFHSLPRMVSHSGYDVTIGIENYGYDDSNSQKSRSLRRLCYPHHLSNSGGTHVCCVYSLSWSAVSKSLSSNQAGIPAVRIQVRATSASSASVAPSRRALVTCNETPFG